MIELRIGCNDGWSDVLTGMVNVLSYQSSWLFNLLSINLSIYLSS